MAQAVDCVIMRGGTSKAVFLREEDLPADADSRRKLILRIYGSPDRRQIDGLGGADPLTSKLAVIGPPPPPQSGRPPFHLTYTFGQVEINTPEIDWRSLCGNITSAVGLYAIEEGFVPATAPITYVRIYNTNLKRLLTVEVPVESGKPVETGSFVVPGVPGSGARISIDFSDTAGGATGRLLPTGKPIDRLTVPGFGEIDMSLVDIGNAHVFVRARDVGMKGTETASEIDANPDLLDLLERIRGVGAAKMGMIPEAARSRQESPATPILGVVGPPADYYNDIAGSTVSADEVDLVSRLQFMQQTHKTYAGTSTVCTGVASRIPGTIVNECARRREGPLVRIGHPAGVIETETALRTEGGEIAVERATLGRTARRILKGTVFVPEGTLG
ncbi:2-methylaconitate cis-trans isomerase PrpF family protein [Oleispirillum naphthae]|uniref:2-methylaconitate cis-trans isomerase PrpF family protein n=1 Tax=Oleispirillum naphthae TaxID=2838853 RepID=UPI003082407F